MNARAEVLLVLECTRSVASDESTARIRKYIENGVNWMALIQFAIVHGVLPLVARTLKESSANLLPRGVLFQFDRVLTRAEVRNHLQWKITASIVHRFEKERVRLLVFKGAALTSLVYGNFRLRESHDIDLWVAPEDTAKAGEILRSLGYLPAILRGGKAVATTNSLVEQFEFISIDGETPVDLMDLRAYFYFKPDFNELWERRAMAEGSGLSLPTLSPEDYLLALAAHGDKHAWRRLNWVVDVDRLLTTSSTFNWDSIWARAIHWRCHRRLCSTLAIRSTLYSSSATCNDVAKYLSDWTTKRVISSLLQAKVTSKPRRTLLTDLKAFFSTYHLIDRPTDRANHLYKEIRPRLLRLPSTLHKRVGFTSRIVAIGRCKLHLYYPRVLLRVELEETN